METKKMTPKQAGIEYRRRLNSGDYKVPGILVGKSIIDVLELPEFVANLAAYMNEQKMSREAMLSARKDAISKGKFIPRENRPCIDRVMELGLMENPKEFAFEFAKVLNGCSEHPAEVRTYINQLGNLAYRLTVEQLICAENSDMEELVQLSKQPSKN